MRVDDLHEPNRFRIEICDATQGPEFAAVAARFEAMLRERWPDWVRRSTGD